MIDGLNTFVSTQPFNEEFYVYTANGPSGNKGYINHIKDATANNCPAGRTLYATGKKLIPGINPMEFFLGKLNPNPVMLVSVYDSVSLLRGFIDPLSPAFSRPYISPAQASAAQEEKAAQEAQGKVAQLAEVAPLAPVEPPALSAKLLLSPRIVFQADDYTVKAAEAGSASIGTISNIPGKLAMKVNTTALTENSLVFLTPLGRGPTLVAVSDLQPSTGQFTIAAGSVCTVNWMIVN